MEILDHIKIRHVYRVLALIPSLQSRLQKKPQADCYDNFIEFHNNKFLEKYLIKRLLH